MTALTGNVSARDGTGNVSGTGLSAMRASFHDNTGGVDVSFTAAPRQLSAVSGTGHVSVHVPPGTVYQVNASSQVGKVNVFVAQSPSAVHVITAITSVGGVSVSNG